MKKKKKKTELPVSCGILLEDINLNIYPNFPLIKYLSTLKEKTLIKSRVIHTQFIPSSNNILLKKLPHNVANVSCINLGLNLKKNMF